MSKNYGRIFAVVVLTVIFTITGKNYFFRFSALESRIYVLPSQDNRAIQVSLIVRADLFPAGLAHYTEHLAWLPNIGIGTRPLDRHSNAWTNDVAIGYWLSGKPEDLADMLRKMAKVFEPITVPDDFAEQERDVILREYDLRLGNNPDAQAAEEMEAFLYAGNAIATSVIGTPAQIKAISYDDAKAFHLATHLPERARLVVKGDLSMRELDRAMVAAGFPDLSSGPAKIAPPPFALAGAETRVFPYLIANAAPRLIWRKVVTLPAPVDFDLLEVQTALLRDILDTNLAGGLAKPLRLDAFVTKSFAINIFPIDEDNVEIVFVADPDKGISFSQLQTTFEAALADAAKGIPPATYARVRERFSGFWPEWGDEKAVNEWMADYVLNRVSVLRDPLDESQVRGLGDQLTAPDIDALLKVLAGPGRTAIAMIGKDQTP